jgi:alpha-1,6-mannosyltransferase
VQVAAAARPARPAVDSRASLAAAAALLLVLGQAATMLLFVNVPAGYKNPAWLTREAADLFGQLIPYPSLTLDPESFPALAAVALVIGWLGYLLAVRARPSLTFVFGVAAAVELLLVFMPPVLSSDLFLYGVFGRMVAFGTGSPYAATGVASADPIAAFTQWSGKASLYGPTWTIVSTAVAAIAGQSILATALGFKLIAALCHLANGALVYRIAARLGADGPAAALLYLWNPLILLESAGSGHNDAFMVMLVLGGVLAALDERRTLACALVALAVLVKYLPLVLLFFFAARWAAKETTWPRRLIELVRPAAVMSIVGVLLYLPFVGPGADFLAPIADYSQGHFHTPIRIGLLQLASPSVVSTGLTLSFGLLVLRLGWAVWRRPVWTRVLLAWAVAAFYYVAVVYPWNFPWYVITPLATLVALPLTPRARGVFAVAAVAGLSWTWIQYAVLIPL